LFGREVLADGVAGKLQFERVGTEHESSGVATAEQAEDPLDGR
jgi:hypothetical protein